MRGRGILVALLALGLPQAAVGAGPDLSAVVQLEGAVSARHTRAQKMELRVEPEARFQLGGVELRGVARLRADAFDRLEPGHPEVQEVSKLSRRWFLGDPVDYELRELTASGRLGPVHLTVGKQQVVWGQADGLKVLDVVDPQDFREFILDDFDESRIPLWTVNAEASVAPHTQLQVLLVPDPSFHELPEPGSVFAFTSERLVGAAPPPGVPVRIEPVDRPRRLVADGDAGARLSGFSGGWDWSLAYLYRYDDRPALRRSLELGPTGPFVSVSPTYERQHLVGGSFSNAFGDFTLRGEVAWQSRRALPSGDPTDADGVKHSGDLGYVLGLDWFGPSDTFLSMQVFQSWLLSYPRGLYRRRLDTNVTFYARRDFMNQRLQLDAMWIHNMNDGDGVVRPKVSYEVRDGLSVWAGIDLFYGRSRGLFGQYGDRDRLVVGMRWGI